MQISKAWGPSAMGKRSTSSRSCTRPNAPLYVARGARLCRARRPSWPRSYTHWVLAGTCGCSRTSRPAGRSRGTCRCSRSRRSRGNTPRGEKGPREAKDVRGQGGGRGEQQSAPLLSPRRRRPPSAPPRPSARRCSPHRGGDVTQRARSAACVCVARWSAPSRCGGARGDGAPWRGRPVGGFAEGARGREAAARIDERLDVGGGGDVAPARPGHQGRQGGRCVAAVHRERGEPWVAGAGGCRQRGAAAAARRRSGSTGAVRLPRPLRKRRWRCGSVHVAPPPDRWEIRSRKVPGANR